MGLYRIYTNSEDKTQIDELDLASNPELTTKTSTQHIFFREWATGHFIDWHPAPRRQYIISLSGTVDVGLEDGTIKHFVPGDARLVEDTTGKGHTTRVTGDEPAITAVIRLR